MISEECDYLVRMPMRGKISSLNASVAAGIVLYEIGRRRGTAGQPKLKPAVDAVAETEEPAAGDEEVVLQDEIAMEIAEAVIDEDLELPDELILDAESDDAEETDAAVYEEILEDQSDEDSDVLVVEQLEETDRAEEQHGSQDLAEDDKH